MSASDRDSAPKEPVAVDAEKSSSKRAVRPPDLDVVAFNNVVGSGDIEAALQLLRQRCVWHPDDYAGQEAVFRLLFEVAFGAKGAPPSDPLLRVLALAQLRQMSLAERTHGRLEVALDVLIELRRTLAAATPEDGGELSEDARRGFKKLDDLLGAIAATGEVLNRAVSTLPSRSRNDGVDDEGSA